MDIEWEIAQRELKRCLTEEKSRAHSAFKLAQIKQKSNENLRIFILRYQDLHSVATGKTAAEDTDPTHIIRFLGMMTNSEIARKIMQKGIPEGMTLGQAFTRAIELEAGYQLSEGVSLARPPEIMQVQEIEEVDEIAALQRKFKDVVSGADPGFDQGGAQIVTGLKLPFWGLSFVEFWCWGLIFGGRGAWTPGAPLDLPLSLLGMWRKRTSI